MKPILTPAAASDLDRRTQERGIADVALMENAGREVARAAADVAGGLYGRRAVVVCGKGNNGGDGLVAARYLSRWGVRVTVLLLGEPRDLREPAAANLSGLEGTDVRIRRYETANALRELDRADVTVDGVFGTGFRGMPENEFAEAIRSMNDANAPIVAVDIPSGVNGETGATEGDAVWADATVTFGALKVGLVLHPGVEHAGVVDVADIGFPADLLTSDLWLVEDRDVVVRLPVRAPDTSKYGSGVLLVIAGSRAMTGAPRLIAEAAYRMGAGLVRLAVPEGILAIEQAALTEATFVALPETAEGTIATAASETLAPLLAGVDAVAIGPGLTRNEETSDFVRSFVRRCPVPFVLDADGLNAFAGGADALAQRGSPAVLTPHAGEFARLVSSTSREVERERVRASRELAARTQACVLLKGPRTLVASPDGQAYVNPTGDATLATGGSGDVLTGMIGALIARGVAPSDAAMVGAYVHGVAGELAGRAAGEATVAGDLPVLVSEAVRRVEGAG